MCVVLSVTKDMLYLRVELKAVSLTCGWNTYKYYLLYNILYTY